MASAQDIRKLVLRYVSGEISASDFANHSAPILKAAIKSHETSAKKLALAVHAQVAHYFNGLVLEGEFRSNLKLMSQEPVNVMIGVSSINLSVNRYQVIETAFPAPSAFSGTSHAREFWSAQTARA